MRGEYSVVLLLGKGVVHGGNKETSEWMNRCNKYIWNKRNGQPLSQMIEQGKNLTDVRVHLGVKSVK